VVKETKYFRKQAAKAERMARTVSDAEIAERFLNMARAYRSQANVLKAKKKSCACRKLNSGILVMQSAQGWATKNVPGAIDGARDRCIFLQG
jgi:hypothetical protein